MGTKINLVSPQNMQPVEGYDNIGVEQLQAMPDSSCEEILLMSTLEYLGLEALQNIAKKMRHGCVLKIQGTDLKEISRKVELGILPVEVASQALSNRRVSIFDPNQILQAANSLMLRVNHIAIRDNQYVIELMRD